MADGDGVRRVEFESHDDTDQTFEEGNLARRALYKVGAWHYVGIWAQAELVVEGVIQTIRSAGLWGVESDAGADYVRSIEDEEYAELARILAKIGFPVPPIEELRGRSRLEHDGLVHAVSDDNGMYPSAGIEVEEALECDDFALVRGTTTRAPITCLECLAAGPR